MAPQSADSVMLLQRMRGEFQEMPGLKLTVAQAARLWHLDLTGSAVLLDRLVTDGLLMRSASGAYVVASETAPSAPFRR